MTSIETTGKTFEDAVETAAGELGVPVEQVKAEIIEEESAELLDLGHKVRVRAEVIGVESADAQTAQAPSGKKSDQVISLLGTILRAMQFDTRPVLLAEDGEEITIDIQGASEDISRLIGRQGQALDALQYLLAVAANRHDMRRTRVILDAEGYRDRHQRTLEAKALDYAAEVKSSGEEAVLEPQNSRDRRIVHMALADDPGVMTYSEGMGDDRHVVISPRK